MKQDKYYISWQKIIANRRKNYIPKHTRVILTEEEKQIKKEQLKIKYKELSLKYRLNPENKEKLKARKILFTNLRNGNIEKQPCEICGELKVHAHHTDYSKPLDVKWLCALHHGEKHRKDL